MPALRVQIPQVRKKDAFFRVNLVLDLYFSIDLLLNFRLTREYVDRKSGKVVRVEDGPGIARGYLQGWFFLDFLSIFPFDWVGARSVGFSGGGTAKLLRCLRLVKLLRLLRGSRALAKLQPKSGLTLT